ncbi:MAG: glycosyltransferase WbuB, partial [Rhodospirillales bacterium]|nr:glycosyltransferase WbuB [Rhodospirillales bacterium]
MARALAQRGHRVTMACGRFEGASTGLQSPFRQGRREGLVHGIRVVEFNIAYRNAMGLGAR